MGAGTRSTDVLSTTTKNAQRGREQLRLLATGGLYVVSTAALLRAVPLLIDNPMAATVLGAAAVSLVAARADVKSERFGPRARRRMLWGLGVSVAATIVGVLTVLATGGSLTTLGVSSAAFFGVVEATAIGYSREMWLRGIPLSFAERAGVPERWALGFATLAGPAAVALESSATPTGIALTALSSAAFAAMWLRGGDGQGPIAAHVAWVWLTDAALSGELFDLTQSSGRFSAGPGAHGTAAIAAGAVFALAAAAMLTDKIPLSSVRAEDFPDEPPPEPRAAKASRKKRGKRRERR